MKPGEIVYDFDKLDANKEFQEALNYVSPLDQEGEPRKIDMDRCKEGIRLVNEKHLYDS